MYFSSTEVVGFGVIWNTNPEVPGVAEAVKGVRFNRQGLFLPNLHKAICHMNRTDLNPEHTFDTFAVGPSNQFAHAVARRVGEEPGTVYNPVLLYGNSGLGKTHLMNAIGNEIVNRNPELKISYLSAELFVNELVAAIRCSKTAEFKEKFAGMDLLLIDDIHYISGKGHTIKMIAGIVSSLYERNRQIVFAGGRSTADIVDIKGMFISGFSKSLIADIQPPDIRRYKRRLLTLNSIG